MTYVKKVGIALDQLVNAVLGGWPDETLSSRAYRWYTYDGIKWPMLIINNLWFWEKEHCEASYESERQDRHLPPEMRD